MSDFDDFDTFDIDESFLESLDSIEAAATASSSTAQPAAPVVRAAPAVQPSLTSRIGANSPFKAPSRGVNNTNAESGPSRRAAALGLRRPPPMPSSDDYDDVSFTAESLAQIDTVVKTTAKRTVIPSSNLNGNARSFKRQDSTRQLHLNFRRENPYTKGKRWDRTAYAASGRRHDAEKAKKKGKRKRMEDVDEEENEEDTTPLAPDGLPTIDTSKPYAPQLHHYNDVTIKTYIYPTNHPKRNYQYEIIRSCFTDNCLVALPTGLGKTFVAGVVMLNWKIVFMAPTKPLVAQQIEACQLTCGIPSSAAAVMTGETTSGAKRDRLWDEKRVFYCTPQTVQSDLERGALNPRDIVLAVVDEAHKASGSYAYTTVIARITAVSPYFRVLALTATPGNTVEKVQGVVDSLHISRIEIREAESNEVTQYMNEKKVELHVIPIDGVIRETQTRWANLMRPKIKAMVDKGILSQRDLDPSRLRPYPVQVKRAEMMRRPEFKWIYGPMDQIRKMAAAMSKLLEYSLGNFYDAAQELSGSSNAKGKKGNTRAGSNALHNDREYQALMTDVEFALNDIKTGRNGKSKADIHPKMQKTLELAEEDAETHGVKNDTRAMVFTTFRSSVLEIVEALNEHPGLLRATKFVGQGAGKTEGDTGFKQKDQKQAIADFKNGKFNVIVSTSVGEEGLDIGEVDFIVIYDMPPQSIKQIQRIGRTGRKRDGIVHVLMTEGREDGNWEKAQQTHREIQKEILLNRHIELFEDVERLLPEGDLPDCVEEEMPVDPWDPAAQNTQLPSVRGKGANGKAKRAPVMSVPEGAEGFKSVSAWLKQGTGKGRKGGLSALRDYDDENELETEEDVPLLHGSSSKSKSSGRKKVAGSRTTKKAKQGAKDKSAAEIAAEKAAEREAAEERARREREELDSAAIDFFNTQGLVRAPSPDLASSPPARSPSPASSSGIRWTPSPKLASRPPLSNSPANRHKRPRGTPLFEPAIDLSFDDDEEDVLEERPRPSTLDKSMPPPPLPVRSSPQSPAVGTPASRRAPSATTPLTDSTEPTPFPVRVRRRVGVVGSSPDMSPSQNLQRLRRRGGPHIPQDDGSSPIVRRRRKDLHGAYAEHDMLDLDAVVSGSESSDEASECENSQDRNFAGEFQATQAPRGYNQHAVYAAGLSTQACSRAGLRFDRNGAEERSKFLGKATKPVLLSDDERDRERDSEDEYEVGSFVCDDEDVDFASK